MDTQPVDHAINRMENAIARLEGALAALAPWPQAARVAGQKHGAENAAADADAKLVEKNEQLKSAIIQSMDEIEILIRQLPS